MMETTYYLAEYATRLCAASLADEVGGFFESRQNNAWNVRISDILMRTK